MEKSRSLKIDFLDSNTNSSIHPMALYDLIHSLSSSLLFSSKEESPESSNMDKEWIVETNPYGDRFLCECCEQVCPVQTTSMYKLIQGGEVCELICGKCYQER